MKLIGDLKKNVEKAADLKEAKEIIREVGVELTDEELEQVAGGMANWHVDKRIDTTIM
ncbi:MAG: class IIb bacteriocin, lactobin A/cerein 7B family [Butyrivibrio sp.]|nr:class IIb bacteriocin, lactobin A/cerein 7B family [Butyrivibrio sp.]